MEDFLQGLGVVAVVLLALIGLAAGWLASIVAGGRHRVRYMVTGVIAALATPFVLALLGVGALVGAGLLALLAVAAVGAVLVLALVSAISGNKGDRR